MAAALKARTLTIEWFREQELPKGSVHDAAGTIHEWFHGIISRKEAERLILGHDEGHFLVRVSDKRHGYVLSYRNSSGCRHYVIGVDSAAPAPYSMLGGPENNAFKRLEQLIAEYQENEFNADGDVLEFPVGQEDPTSPNYADLLPNSSAQPTKAPAPAVKAKPGKAPPPVAAKPGSKAPPPAVKPKPGRGAPAVAAKPQNGAPPVATKPPAASPAAVAPQAPVEPVAASAPAAGTAGDSAGAADADVDDVVYDSLPPPRAPTTTAPTGVVEPLMEDDALYRNVADSELLAAAGTVEPLAEGDDLYRNVPAGSAVYGNVAQILQGSHSRTTVPDKLDKTPAPAPGVARAAGSTRDRDRPFDREVFSDSHIGKAPAPDPGAGAPAAAPADTSKPDLAPARAAAPDPADPSNRPLPPTPPDSAAPVGNAAADPSRRPLPALPETSTRPLLAVPNSAGAGAAAAAPTPVRVTDDIIYEDDVTDAIQIARECGPEYATISADEDDESDPPQRPVSIEGPELLASQEPEQTDLGTEVELYTGLADAANRTLVGELASFCVGAVVNIPDRYVLARGLVTKMCRGGPRRRILLLFNDVVMYGRLSDKKFSGLRSIPLAGASVVDPGKPVMGIHNVFCFKSPTKSFFVGTQARSQKDAWVKVLNEAIPKANEAAGMFCPARELRIDPTDEDEGEGFYGAISAPKLSGELPALSNEAQLAIFQMVKDGLSIDEALRRANVKEAAEKKVQKNEEMRAEKAAREWGLVAPAKMIDAGVSMCMLCTCKFNLSRRRHHCQGCGKVFCAECCSFKVPLPYLNGKVDTVCHECFAISRDREGAQPETDWVRKQSKKYLQRQQVMSTLKKQSNPELRLSASASEGSNNIVLSGFAWHQRPTKKEWKKRWLVLRATMRLYVYKAPEDVISIAMMDVKESQVLRADEITDKAAVLKVVPRHAVEQVDLIGVDSERDIEIWIKALRKA